MKQGDLCSAQVCGWWTVSGRSFWHRLQLLPGRVKSAGISLPQPKLLQATVSTELSSLTFPSLSTLTSKSVKSLLHSQINIYIYVYYFHTGTGSIIFKKLGDFPPKTANNAYFRTLAFLFLKMARVTLNTSE